MKLESILSVLLLGGVGLLSAQQKVTLGTASAFLKNGVCVRITAEARSAGKAKAMGSGVSVRENNILYRLFRDGQNRLAFGYEVEVERVPGSAEFRVMLKPLSESYLQFNPEERLAPGSDAQHLPTFSSERELPLYAPGDRASLDVLANPATGETITDTIEVSFDTPDQASARDFSEHPYRFALRNLRVFRNGKLISPERNPGSVSGNHMLIYLPGYGAYVLTNEPQTGYAIQKLGYVEGSKLSFTLDGDAYEFLADAPILPRTPAGEVWVVHDPAYRPKGWQKARSKDEFFTAAADEVRFLLPRP
jgi:hypothetical protein